MNVTPLIQATGTPEDRSIGATLTRFLRRRTYDQLQVAMAYVSVAGVRALLQACGAVPDLRSEWLVGLDDLVTHPGAIDLVRGLRGSEVRIASLGARPYRFHPKVCRIRSIGDRRSEVVMIGSANLTRAALAGNSEAVVFLESNSERDGQLFDRMWSDLWSQGHVPNAEELDAYRSSFERARPLRASLRELQSVGSVEAAPSVPIVEQDAAELDPSHASTCWIECGSVTALGRELELKSEQGLFFGLNSDLATEEHFQFRVSNGADVRLRMKYQENGMWRVQMTNAVPEVRAGLRPALPAGGLGRSSYVAVFSRGDKANHFLLTFLDVASGEFAALKRRSLELGTSSRTRPGPSGRDYGWC